jgi:membrane-bound lytic murein transglycosylase D
MRSHRRHILLCFLVSTLLAPAPMLSAADRAGEVIATCELVERAQRPWANGSSPVPPALLSADLAEVPAKLSERVAFWHHVWADAGEGVVFLVDGRRPEIVHAVVDCGAYAHDDVEAKNRCGQNVTTASRAVRTTLRATDRASKSTVRQRYASAPTLKSDAADHVRAVRGRKDALARAVVRAAPYLVELEEIFASHGVPTELARLPIVESLFRPHAQSSAGAVGAFQFTTETGKAYLRIDAAVDDRRDVLRAGDAAARYLAALHRRFGRFDLALTAYNTGPGRLSRMIKKSGSKDLGVLIERSDDGRFGFDGQNYVAQVLATIAASDALSSTTSRASSDFARLKTGASLASLSRCLEMPVTTIVDANPGLTDAVRTGAYPVPKGYVLALPGIDLPRVALAEALVDDA